MRSLNASRYGMLLLMGGVGLCVAGTDAAPPKVQFSREVLPVFVQECLPCHRGSAAGGGYLMENAAQLLAGGRHGAAIVPGKGEQGTLLGYLTGKLKPQMPPGKPLPLETVNLIKRWIDEGAKIDSMTITPAPGAKGTERLPGKPGTPGRATGKAQSPFLPLPVAQSAPVTGLAYHPEGKVLAAAGYRAVRLLHPETGEVLHTLSGPTAQVTALAWSADGKWLAAAGGEPGVSGEVCVWSFQGDRLAVPKPRVFSAHTDAITSISWRPGAPEFATASFDKTVKIWNATNGTVLRTLQDHVDVVFGVAYSRTGRWLATGSADRTLKLYQTERYGRVSSFTNRDPVTAVSFRPDEQLVVAVAEKQVYVWPVKEGTVENPLRSRGEGDVINAVAFSANGNLFVWGAANRRVRFWDGEVNNHRREMSDCPDWVYSVAVSPDGKTAAAGGGDGKVYFWNVEDGKLLRVVGLGPGAVLAADGKESK